MLQELTENDFDKGINKSLSRKKLLMIYNYLRDHQEENHFYNFYYDDNFYWDPAYILKSMRYSKEMINGVQLYHYQFNWDMNEQTEQILFDLVKPSNKYILKKYVYTILNKFRPTEEFNKIMQQQKQNKVEKTIEEEAEQEQFEKYMDNKKTEEHMEIKRSVLQDAFIYRIIVDNKIVYIGKTTRSLKKRIEEHIECVLNPNINNSQQNYLYKAMRSCQGYRFEIVYESHGLITNRELEELEKAMIEGFKPDFNYEGVKVPYRFSDEK